jgi:hypothetical protein
MLARQIIIVIADGDIDDINNIRDQVKTLIESRTRSHANVVLTHEDIFELQAYLHLLSAAQQYRRRSDWAPVDQFLTGSTSPSPAFFGAPEVSEQVFIWAMQHRRVTDRNGLRYSSDSTAEEWQLVQGLIPPIKLRGRKRKTDMREVLNGILYVLSIGCRWNALPKDLPRTSTVLGYFHRWSRDGTLQRIHDRLYV